MPPYAFGTNPTYKMVVKQWKSEPMKVGFSVGLRPPCPKRMVERLPISVFTEIMRSSSRAGVQFKRYIASLSCAGCVVPNDLEKMPTNGMNVMAKLADIVAVYQREQCSEVSALLTAGDRLKDI